MILTKPNMGWITPLAAVLFCIFIYKIDPLPMQVLRNATFDQYQRWEQRHVNDSLVRVVDIDEASLAKIGQWPWARTRLAELVARLQDAGAAAITFDIVFSEPDRTSPQAMLKTWKAGPTIKAALASLPDNDTVFAQTIANGGVVLGYVPVRRAPFTTHLARPYKVAIHGTAPTPFLSYYPGTVASLPSLQDAAAGNGAFSFSPDGDGVVRRVPLLLRTDFGIVPSLGAESLRIYYGSQRYAIATDAATGIQSVGIGPIAVPTNENAEIWVHYAERSPALTIPAWKLLDGPIDASTVRDKIVLIGTSAPGLVDLRFSPLGGLIPGVDVHANIIDQITAHQEISRPTWVTDLELFILVVGGLVIGYVAISFGAIPSAAVFTLAMLAAGLWGWFGFIKQGLLFDPITPGAGLLLVFGISSLQHHIVSERRQRWVKQAFARYVSPNLVSYLVDHPGELSLGGHRRECSFIFTDLAGFTSLMESLDAALAVTLLNDYLDNMIRIAFKHQGTLDRIVGDAVAVMFSAPVDQPDHRTRAVQCAQEMHAFSNQYSIDARARGIAFGITRIGIHTGEVTVGNFGGTTIFDYRALGDPVNTASRLESVNKQLGTQVCLSEATLSGCPDTVARPVGKLVLKGKSVALQVYEPAFASNAERCAPPAEYAQAYAMMAHGDPASRTLFSTLAQRWPLDPLVHFHLNRIENGQTGDIIVFAQK